MWKWNHVAMVGEAVRDVAVEQRKEGGTSSLRNLESIELLTGKRYRATSDGRILRGTQDPMLRIGKLVLSAVQKNIRPATSASFERAGSASIANMYEHTF
jgi:hypothetical protein